MSSLKSSSMSSSLSKALLVNHWLRYTKVLRLLFVTDLLWLDSTSLFVHHLLSLCWLLCTAKTLSTEGLSCSPFQNTSKSTTPHAEVVLDSGSWNKHQIHLQGLNGRLRMHLTRITHPYLLNEINGRLSSYALCALSLSCNKIDHIPKPFLISVPPQLLVLHHHFARSNIACLPGRAEGLKDPGSAVDSVENSRTMVIGQICGKVAVIGQRMKSYDKLVPYRSPTPWVIGTALSVHS